MKWDEAIIKQFTIISLLVGSGSPNKYSYEIGGSANDRPILYKYLSG